jgi:hypothetical protein
MFQRNENIDWATGMFLVWRELMKRRVILLLNAPVDILGDAGAKRYAKAVEMTTKDPNNDGVLVILAPQAMTEATATAEQLKPFAKLDGKPIREDVQGACEILGLSNEGQ